MKRLLALCLLAIGGCVSQPDGGSPPFLGTTKTATWAVQTYADSARGVVCYIAYKEGISCVKVTP